MAQFREHILSRAAVVFTSIAQCLHLVGIGRRASFFHEDDCHFGSHLTPLSGCHPVDSVTGDRPNGPVTLDEYRALVTPGALLPTTRTLCARLGINAAAWLTTIGKVGLFQGVAVGKRTSCVAFAAAHGKNVIADKTGLRAKS